MSAMCIRLDLGRLRKSCGDQPLSSRAARSMPQSARGVPAMKPRWALAAALSLVCAWGRAELVAAPPPRLSGRWVLNHALSEFPKEVAFGIDTSGVDAPQV